MSDNPTLSDRITAAIEAHCAESGLGIPQGFIYCVSHIDKNGEQVMTLGDSGLQSTHVSLGLAHLLVRNYELDVDTWLMAACQCEDDDE